MSVFERRAKNSPVEAQLDMLRRHTLLDSMKLDDLYALQLLNSLIAGYPYIPFTGSSIRPFCLAHIINDIVINERSSILELGSGISTLMIARLILKNSLPACLISVEHEAGWAITVSRLLQEEGLSDVARVIHAPLKPCPVALESNEWYDLEILDRETSGKHFDMLIVDGPPAYEPLKFKARYPALPYAIDKLSESYAIYLDDANRHGEKAVLHEWHQNHGLNFRLVGSTLGVVVTGKTLFTDPFLYYPPVEKTVNSNGNI